MKVLAFLLSTSPSLYSSGSIGPHFLAPRISASANFLGSPFIRPVLKHVKFSIFAMATCVHTSRTETPAQAKSNRTNVDDRAYQNYVKYCRPNSADIVSCAPISDKWPNIVHTCAPTTVLDDGNVNREEDVDNLWKLMKDEASSDIDEEPILSNYYFSSILLHDSMESALANHLAMKLSNSSLPSGTLYDLFRVLLTENQDIMRAVKDDLRAVKERDPACISYVHCFLNFKGYLACQAHRVAHKLWLSGRKILALLIQSRVSEVFAVDIHPGAKIGRGILLDHATGVVIGETAVIGNNVSILHNVTLGGTGKVSGDRHPKIGDGVLIGAGTCVLGNVRIEDGAKIGAGSVVLKQVPARTTAVGNPAKLIGGKENPIKLDKLPSLTMDHTSHISEWSDYVI